MCRRASTHHSDLSDRSGGLQARPDGAEGMEDFTRGLTLATKALDERLRNMDVAAALAALDQAADKDARKKARDTVVAVRATLVAVVDGATRETKRIEGLAMGGRRYGSSLAHLERLRAQADGSRTQVVLALLRADGGQASAPQPGHGVGLDQALRELVVGLKAAAGDARIRPLTDLYFTADLWLKAAGVGSAKRVQHAEVDLENKPEVLALYQETARELAERAGVTVNKLPQWLEERAGKGMGVHGTQLDVRDGNALWMTEDQRDVFRVHVVGGKLHQYPWWEWEPEDLKEQVWESKGRINLKNYSLEPIDSARTPSTGVITEGYTGFAMSMGGDLYVTRQAPEKKVEIDGQSFGASLYHSSYMAGLPILMAGELLVDNGQVMRVNTDSGHYCPPRPLLVRFVKLLRAQGVSVAEVGDHRNQNVMTADEFLRLHGDEELDGDANALAQQQMAEYRQEIFFSKLFPDQRAKVSEARSQVNALGKVIEEVEEAVHELTYADHDDRAKRAKRELTLKKAKVERRKAVAASEAARDELPGVLAVLTARLEERQRNNMEVRTKSGVVLEEDGHDGYVEALESLIATTIDYRVQLDQLLEAARSEPTPPPLVAPWDLPNHGELDLGATEALLTIKGKWLLRISENTGDWVVSQFNGGGFAHVQVGELNRNAVYAAYGKSEIIRP